ncbi:diguanylate cyclase [Halanaerobacter jeridensis]|uniref:Diguanylate cyclase (GGDEF)-like protein/PAS domain S-box-containing protein n=1 Tax=Halanaerobacter jeridensis TaxID=706427 RepID=A0A938XSZ5_9FIRM|nr:diguanylate cyclase (GGDEF)-like protein/PAS domain S-box-containing protein [Halanaerobacter jeridensis]
MGELIRNKKYLLIAILIIAIIVFVFNFFSLIKGGLNTEAKKEIKDIINLDNKSLSSLIMIIVSGGLIIALLIIFLIDQVCNRLNIEQREKKQKIKERLEMAIKGAKIGVWDWNSKTGEVKFNQQWAQMLGYELSDLESNIQAWEKRIHADDKKRVFKKLKQHLAQESEYYRSEHRLRTKDGNWKWIRDIGKVVKRDENNNPVRVVGIHQDIDDRKRAQQKVEYLSFHDGLTDLYNRRYFQIEQKKLNKSRRFPISIIIADLDGLKLINDNYGHKMGDKYIKKVADIFTSICRGEDVVARIGGDEFALLLPETNSQDVKKICNRFNNKLEEVNKQEQLVIKLSVSLGWATKTSSEENLEQIFEDADKMMYENKNSRKELIFN